MYIYFHLDLFCLDPDQFPPLYPSQSCKLKHYLDIINMRPSFIAFILSSAALTFAAPSFLSSSDKRSEQVNICGGTVITCLGGGGKYGALCQQLDDGSIECNVVDEFGVNGIVRGPRGQCLAYAPATCLDSGSYNCVCLDICSSEQ